MAGSSVGRADGGSDGGVRESIAAPAGRKKKTTTRYDTVTTTTTTTTTTATVVDPVSDAGPRHRRW